MIHHEEDNTMPATETAAGSGVQTTAPQRPEYAEILTPQALALVAKLHRAFDGRRQELLARRAVVQARLDDGWLPDFLEETKSLREGDWRIAPIPPDLLDRRVEITGPVDRKMVINALNSGAKVFMADSRMLTRPHGMRPSRARSTFATRSAGSSITRVPTARSTVCTSTLPRSWSGPAAGT